VKVILRQQPHSFLLADKPPRTSSFASEGDLDREGSEPREVHGADFTLFPVFGLPLVFCAPKHPSVGFEGIDLAYPCGIVMSEVDAGTHADLKDICLRQRDYALPDFVDGFGFPSMLTRCG
jgi:hypothetical protein